jgi:hypothetical protein
MRTMHGIGKIEPETISPAWIISTLAAGRPVIADPSAMASGQEWNGWPRRAMVSRARRW